MADITKQLREEFSAQGVLYKMNPLLMDRRKYLCYLIKAMFTAICTQIWTFT